MHDDRALVESGVDGGDCRRVDGLLLRALGRLLSQRQQLVRVELWRALLARVVQHSAGVL
jgi:hypothetical protein